MKGAISSLRGIFLLWHPETSASFDERMEVVDAVRERYPTTSWKLMLAVIPGSHDVATPTSRPQWRNWVSKAQAPSTYVELGRQIGAVVDRLLEDADSAQRWRDLVRVVDTLPRDDFDRVIYALTQTQFDTTDSEELAGLWASLREMVAHHWEFPEADWALPDALVQDLFTLYQTLTPHDPLKRVSWLFSMTPKLPVRGVGSAFEARDAEAAKERVSAIQEIAAEGGLPMILALVGVADSPWHVGLSLAQATTNVRGDLYLREVLGASEPRLADAAQGFLRGTIMRGGIEALDLILNDEQSPWGPTERAQIYLAYPFDLETWDRLENEPDVQRVYWASVWPHGRGKLSNEIVRRAGKELLRYAEATTAVDFLALYRGEFQPDIALEALTKLAAAPPTEPGILQRLGHDISSLLQGLHQSGVVDEDDLATLEWTYLPILSRVEHGYRPPTLDRVLAQNPRFFVDVLKTIYRAPTDNESAPPSEEETARAQQGFELLYRWTTVPGSLDGDLDEGALRAWIGDVRLFAQSDGLDEIADVHVGQILAHAPEGRDGEWPHEAVRNLIEELANDVVERGFETQVYNNRGGTTRAIGEGGTQERDLAQQWAKRSSQLISRWPRTGAVLLRIARGYETDARREDERAENDRSRWE